MVIQNCYVDSVERQVEMGREGAEALSLHEQLVRHVLAVNGELELRSNVWGEHSYARARRAAGNSRIRELLPLAHSPELDLEDYIDVETEPRKPPAPPLDSDDCPDDDNTGEDEADDDWEERLLALAPNAAYVRLASTALVALRDLRLERLSGARGRWARHEGSNAAARRLRRALATHWGGGAAWLHAALLACLPRSLALLYAEVVAELRRAVPRLAARLPAPRSLVPYVDPLSAVDERRAASASGPWLAWAPSGCEAEDERWVRRLGALLYLRVLCAAPRAPAAPERWCAALAHDARTALTDIIADAGKRPVILCGVGAGAALSAWLVGGAGTAAGGLRLRGALLLAPPLLTAEGPRDIPEDILEEVDVPLLAVVGGGAAQSWRGAACELACRAAAEGAAEAEGATRRVLVVGGADDALRLPRAHRRRLNLPQHALDAAIVEECVRWVLEAVKAPEPAPRERTKRRLDKVAAVPPATEDSEAAHPGPAPGPAPTSLGNRSIEIIEGRVVSRVSGGSPLALLPPRRRDDTIAVADIMQLPIVFADDEAAAAPAPTPSPAPSLIATDAMNVLEAASPLTVTSGNPRLIAAEAPGRRGARGGVRRVVRGGRGVGELRYTRVIVAKRPSARLPRASSPVLLRRRPPPPSHSL